jgi:menaquinone-dependent protoporphyrinogen oxidase
MMNLLVVYATTEGQTRKIAQFVADRIKVHGHGADLVDATDPASADVRLRGYDGVIVAGSVHVGKFQTAIEDFVRVRHQMLNGMRSVFLPVSLSAASKDADDLKGLAECTRKFLAETGWKPGETHNVAGAFRYTQYDFFKRWGMKMIAYQKGVSTDTSRDLELTDWVALTRAVDGFVATVEGVQRAMVRS